MMLAQHPSHPSMTISGKISTHPKQQQKYTKKQRKVGDDLRTLNRKIVLVFGLKIQLWTLCNHKMQMKLRAVFAVDARRAYEIYCCYDCMHA